MTSAQTLLAVWLAGDRTRVRRALEAMSSIQALAVVLDLRDQIEDSGQGEGWELEAQIRQWVRER